MIKAISTLALAASLSLAAPAFAQMTTNAQTGGVVDGHGGAGSDANRRHADGPGAGAFVTQTSDGTCYLHTNDSRAIVIHCPRQL